MTTLDSYLRVALIFALVIILILSIIYLANSDFSVTRDYIYGKNESNIECNNKISDYDSDFNTSLTKYDTECKKLYNSNKVQEIINKAVPNYKLSSHYQDLLNQQYTECNKCPELRRPIKHMDDTSEIMNNDVVFLSVAFLDKFLQYKMSPTDATIYKLSVSDISIDNLLLMFTANQVMPYQFKISMVGNSSIAPIPVNTEFTLTDVSTNNTVVVSDQTGYSTLGSPDPNIPPITIPNITTANSYKFYKNSNNKNLKNGDIIMILTKNNSYALIPRDVIGLRSPYNMEIGSPFLFQIFKSTPEFTPLPPP